MKKLALLSIVFFFVFSIVVTAQEVKETTPEEIKAKTKELKKTEEVKETVKTQTVEEVKSSNVVTVRVDPPKNTTTNTTTVFTPKEDKYFFPENIINLDVGGTMVQNPDVKYQGLFSTFSLTQEQESNKKTRIGIGAWFNTGIFEASTADKLSTEKFKGKVQDLGLFLLLVKTNSKKSSVRTQFNVGFIQKTTTGNIGLYSDKQVDRLLVLETYINLTRNKEKSFFPMSELSARYMYPLWVEKTATYNGYAATSSIWNNKMFYAQISQGVVIINLNETVEKLSALVGVTPYYIHQSQDVHDWYGCLVWLQFMHNFQPIVKICYGGQTSNGMPAYNVINANFSLMNLINAF